MVQDSDADAVLEVARQIMAAAGCASFITLDDDGLPSSRPVRTFSSDDTLTTIVVPSDAKSRKSIHLARHPDVALGYVDTPTRGYVTISGPASRVDQEEDKKAAWQEAFAAFWPDGPDSTDHELIVVTPERMEVRSYTQGVADSPTRWTPVKLVRSESGQWRTAS